MTFSLLASVGLVTLKAPFRISGHVFENAPILDVRLQGGHFVGRGEAAGVYYLDDTPQRMLPAIEAVRADIEAGISRADLRRLLPPGGARNAIDAALWELEALRAGVAVWQLAGVRTPRPLLTTMTLSADGPQQAAAAALAFANARALKIKLTGDVDADIARVQAVRAARPDVWLSVDANQGYTPETIPPLLRILTACDVRLLEQPFARGREEDMRSVRFPVRTAADESCLDLAELEKIHPYFDVINIKLDKCGGLTEGLAMAERARALGRGVMVGCMPCTSRGIAPAFVLGQNCDVVDLDAPLAIRDDVTPGVSYELGEVFSAPEVWGGRGA